MPPIAKEKKIRLESMICKKDAHSLGGRTLEKENVQVGLAQEGKES